MRLYLRTTSAHARAILRYGYSEWMATLFREIPPQEGAIDDAVLVANIVNERQATMMEPQNAPSEIEAFGPVAVYGQSIASATWEPHSLADQSRRLEYGEDTEGIVLMCGSRDRLAVLLALRHQMERDEWLRAFGWGWTACDSVWRHFAELREALGEDGPLLAAMSETERKAYAALPDVVTIYRGGSQINRDGASWTLKRSIAARFPTLDRYRTERPRVYTATVPKNRILAVKLDRKEHEVLTFAARIVKSEPLRVKSQHH